MAFPKKIALEYDLSYIMRKDGISFPRKNETWSFSKKYTKIWCFLCVGKGGIFFLTNVKITFCQKSKNNLFPKSTTKDDISGITENEDIHRRKDDIGILFTFMETFLRIFIYCFPIKKPGNLIHRVEIWLYL